MQREHEVLDVQDEVGDVFLHTGDDVELVQRLVEAHLGDGRARDRREQRAAQAVAERVAEAGLERRDRELLEVALGLAGLDLGTLDDEHGCIASDLVIWPVRSATADGGRELLGVELDDELLAHGNVDLLPQRQVAHDRLVVDGVTSSHIGTARSIVSRLCRRTIIFCALAPSR